MDSNIGDFSSLQERLAAVFSVVPERDIEQFYSYYQVRVLQRRLPILEQQLQVLMEHITENQLHIQALRPSAVAQSVLARLQSKEVKDAELLDRMLGQGEDWLDRMMQRLDYCEQVEGFIQGDYTQWCMNSLEGAYDWIDTVRGSTSETPNGSPWQETTGSEEMLATEETLLQKFRTDDEEAMREVTLRFSPRVAEEARIEQSVPDEELLPADSPLTSEEDLATSETIFSAHSTDVAETQNVQETADEANEDWYALESNISLSFDQPGVINDWVKVLEAETVARVEAEEAETAGYENREILVPTSGQDEHGAEDRGGEEIHPSLTAVQDQEDTPQTVPAREKLTENSEDAAVLLDTSTASAATHQEAEIQAADSPDQEEQIRHAPDWLAEDANRSEALAAALMAADDSLDPTVDTTGNSGTLAALSTTDDSLEPTVDDAGNSEALAAALSTTDDSLEPTVDDAGNSGTLAAALSTTDEDPDPATLETTIRPRVITAPLAEVELADPGEQGDVELTEHAFSTSASTIQPTGAFSAEATDDQTTPPGETPDKQPTMEIQLAEIAAAVATKEEPTWYASLEGETSHQIASGTSVEPSSSNGTLSPSSTPAELDEPAPEADLAAMLPEAEVVAQDETAVEPEAAPVQEREEPKEADDDQTRPISLKEIAYALSQAPALIPSEPVVPVANQPVASEKSAPLEPVDPAEQLLTELATSSQIVEPTKEPVAVASEEADDDQTRPFSLQEITHALSLAPSLLPQDTSGEPASAVAVENLPVETTDSAEQTRGEFAASPEIAEPAREPVAVASDDTGDDQTRPFSLKEVSGTLSLTPSLLPQDTPVEPAASVEPATTMESAPPEPTISAGYPAPEQAKSQAFNAPTERPASLPGASLSEANSHQASRYAPTAQPGLLHQPAAVEFENKPPKLSFWQRIFRWRRKNTA